MDNDELIHCFHAYIMSIWFSIDRTCVLIIGRLISKETNTVINTLNIKHLHKVGGSMVRYNGSTLKQSTLWPGVIPTYSDDIVISRDDKMSILIHPTLTIEQSRVIYNKCYPEDYVSRREMTISLFTHLLLNTNSPYEIIDTHMFDDFSDVINCVDWNNEPSDYINNMITFINKCNMYEDVLYCLSHICNMDVIVDLTRDLLGNDRSYKKVVPRYEIKSRDIIILMSLLYVDFIKTVIRLKFVSSTNMIIGLNDICLLFENIMRERKGTLNRTEEGKTMMIKILNNAGWDTAFPMKYHNISIMNGISFDPFPVKYALINNKGWQCVKSPPYPSVRSDIGFAVRREREGITDMSNFKQVGVIDIDVSHINIDTNKVATILVGMITKSRDSEITGVYIFIERSKYFIETCHFIGRHFI